MIQLRNLTLDLGGNHIFEDISAVFQQTDRVGVIGQNGAGKSTLLKVIAGLIPPTSGQVSTKKGARIAYLPQEEILASTLPVFEEVFSAFAVIFETEKRIEQIDKIMADGDCTEELLEEYAELCATAKNISRHDAMQQVSTVLAGLGFTPAMTQKSVNELSTGWKMRLALAKLLVTDADMYLFDEPTNHLDIVTQQWFLQKLKSMQQGFLLVSHDRAYLEKACNKILEIERGRGTYFNGNLQAYLIEKQSQIEIARATRSRQDREIAHKQAIADKFKASAARATQAQNMLKQIERIELVEVQPPLPTVNFHFPTPPAPGRVILTVNNVAYEYNKTPLFQSASFTIERGERVALVAANGVGKTTLINCIAQLNTPTHGTIKLGHGVRSAFFEQDQAQAMDQRKTILQEVLDACESVPEGEIRTLLGAFQFSGETVHKRIKVLSGGEKNRVAMAKVLLQRANFLILDEPTNHLDMYAKDVLRQALESYEGTILFVSHDLDFVSRLATRILELTPTGINSYPGTYEDFCEAKQRQQQVDPTAPRIITTAARKPEACAAVKQPSDKKQTPESQEAARAYKRQIAEFEREINKLERNEAREIEALGQHAYGTDGYFKVVDRLQKIQTTLKETQKEWEATLQKLYECS